jgi:Protein of unknown function (DUF3574)
MRTIFDNVMRSGRAKVFAVSLGVVLTLTLVAATAALAAIAILNTQVGPVSSQSTSFYRTELYFGSERPDGSEVTEQELERFVDDEVTPRFPDGLTLLTGEGQFRDSSGEIIEEHSYVLILLYPPNDKEANAEIEEIREDYKRAFEQESVLRVDDLEQVSF